MNARSARSALDFRAELVRASPKGTPATADRQSGQQFEILTAAEAHTAKVRDAQSVLSFRAEFQRAAAEARSKDAGVERAVARVNAQKLKRALAGAREAEEARLNALRTRTASLSRSSSEARVDVGLARRSATEQRAAEQRKQREAAKLTASVAKERRIARLQGRCASVRRDLHGVDRALVDGA